MGSLCICLLFSQIPIGIPFPLLLLFLIFSLFALLIVSVASQFYLRIASSILHPALLHYATSTFSLILELPRFPIQILEKERNSFASLLFLHEATSYIALGIMV